jgi:molybdate transport system ATP-binding protein
VPGRPAALCPVLDVRDKGRLPTGQALTWVIPSEGIALADPADGRAGGFGATVSDARFLGEITLATIAVDAAPGVSVSLTLAGPQRRLAEAGRRLMLHLDADLVHVMPLR